MISPSTTAEALDRAVTSAPLVGNGRERGAVLKELFKKEPARKTSRKSERYLLDMFRKLRDAEKMALTIFAERLATKRIQERRARKKLRLV